MPITQWNDVALREMIRGAMMRGIVRGTEHIRSEMIRLILETPKSGRTYTRRGVSHRASAPGQPPASDTGQLVNSINTEFIPSELTGIIHVSAQHALYLEYGTATMAPRPFARRAAISKMPLVADYISEEITKGL